MEKVKEMKLWELLNKMESCCACISISGLCDEYDGGLVSLKSESWYKKNRYRCIRWFSIIGFDKDSFELYIELDC